MEPVEKAVWFLQSLLGSIPMPMLTFYLLHCYGEDWRRSALFRTVLAIWGLYVLLLCVDQFAIFFNPITTWENQFRQDLRYLSGVIALLGIGHWFAMTKNELCLQSDPSVRLSHGGIFV